ncbi:hypothetical protein PHET_00497 [Paragonimus heterotremus]|uniref:Uncharacterized protein n=1 Tax=Paragonimus heterotremus TaxID=100268 RepID=A0A8J4TSR4_9TREM|nr:hypothetical protein PHET_00497 [Paragonimus heterotremus]
MSHSADRKKTSSSKTSTGSASSNKLGKLLHRSSSGSHSKGTEEKWCESRAYFEFYFGYGFTRLRTSLFWITTSS